MSLYVLVISISNVLTLGIPIVYITDFTSAVCVGVPVIEGSLVNVSI